MRPYTRKVKEAEQEWAKALLDESKEAVAEDTDELEMIVEEINAFTNLMDFVRGKE